LTRPRIQWRSQEGKITALAIAFIIATKVREQLQEALLLASTCDVYQQGWMIAEHTVSHVAQYMVIGQERSGMITRQQAVTQRRVSVTLGIHQ
jgi:hypothetical protein